MCEQKVIESYQAGIISLGKLSELLVKDPISMQEYLNKIGVKISVQSERDIFQDASNA